MASSLLQPGLSYRVQALVTNQSTRGGLPVAATFTVEWRAGLLKRPLYPTPCDNIGDVNGDGVVNMGDVSLAGAIVVGDVVAAPEQLLRADVDGNGVVNMGDITQIERYIVGADTIFRVCALPPPAGNATLTLLDFFTTEIFAPGEQRLLSQGFNLPRVLVEDMGLAQVVLLAEGQQLAKASAILDVAPAAPIYPLDDWIRATQLNGVESEVRVDFLSVAWSGGLLMEKDEGVISFVELPISVSRATLVLTPTEYFSLLPGDETIVRVNFQEVARDSQTDLARLRIDITSQVNANFFGDRTLLVELSPTPVDVATGRGWLRKYGSVRGVADVRPWIEITI